MRFRWKTGRYLTDALRTIRSSARPFRRPTGEPRDVLILGANAYVGQNLAQAVDRSRLVMLSRAERNPIVARVDAPYVRADLVRSPDALGLVSPREVYVVARPTGGFSEQALFAANLKAHLHSWAATGSLERLVLLSTQLVYATPPDGLPLSTAEPVAPVGSYEYVKAELEMFAKYLVTTFRLNADVFRLPLVYGGHILPSQRRQQLLYSWVDALRQGSRWQLSTDDDIGFGNSWVWLPDLLQAVTRPSGSGFSVRQPVSGDFTYAQLQHAVGRSSAERQPLKLVRSRFFLRDEEGLPPRDLAATIAALSAGSSEEDQVR